jgi:RNA-directed DNA polymerase
MLAAGLVPVLSLGHLAYQSGASYGYLREIVERKRDPYDNIARPKSNGLLRAISSPHPPLMEVQRWILRNVLRSVRIHPSSYAYQANRSIVQCAKQHVGARWLVKLDLHDFFGTIAERSVYRVFQQLGYPPLISFEMARLCTRLRGSYLPYQHPNNSYSSIVTYGVPYPGELPQGAPTSGALANATSYRLDRRLNDIASSRGLAYTRYSDDLTFSAGNDFDRDQAVRLIAVVSHTVANEGFRVHKRKTRVVPPGARQVILGLLVDHDSVRLLPEFRRRIEGHIRGVAKFGLAKHAQHRGFRSVLSFVNHVDGCLAFAFGVQPTIAGQLREAWNDALRLGGFPFVGT